MAQDLDFPKIGVRLQVFDDFINDVCGGHDQIRNMTTTDVCKQFLMPYTASLSCSFCEKLQQDGSTDVAPATVFISHAWKYVFLDVVDSLKHHFRNETTSVIIWFDLFSNNQHCAPQLDFIWWSTTFKSAIAQFGRTVMVIAPWVDPIPFHRAWCLFEVYCTNDSNSKFEVAMSQSELEIFVDAITKNSE